MALDPNERPPYGGPTDKTLDLFWAVACLALGIGLIASLFFTWHGLYMSIFIAGVGPYCVVDGVNRFRDYRKRWGGR